MDKDKEQVSAKYKKHAQPEPIPEPDESEEKDTATEPLPLEKMTKAELIEKVKTSLELADKNQDLYVRSQAEIENIKKRNQKDKAEWIKYSHESLIKELLPVLDNLEKAIAHTNNESSADAIRDGVELTLKGLKDTLAKSGLEEVAAKGERFDPGIHHAVSQQEDETVEPGTVLEELQKGFTLNQRLIRPAMVVVSKGRAGNSTENDTNDNDSREYDE
jgi:molecular chaperone GrpE